ERLFAFSEVFMRRHMGVSMLFGILCFAFSWDGACAADLRVGRQATDRDRDEDGDGLSDFQEVHKYGTDPTKKDSAGMGLTDGDRTQRREFAYSVRAVMRIMPPYTLAALHDDYQDARLIKQTKEYAEVEFVVYPLNTNAEAIEANRNWRTDYASMTEFLGP